MSTAGTPAQEVREVGPRDQGPLALTEVGTDHGGTGVAKDGPVRLDGSISDSRTPFMCPAERRSPAERRGNAQFGSSWNRARLPRIIACCPLHLAFRAGTSRMALSGHAFTHSPQA